MAVMCVSERDSNIWLQQSNPICEGHPSCPARLLYLQQQYKKALEADDHFIDKIILYRVEEGSSK